MRPHLIRLRLYRNWQWVLLFLVSGLILFSLINFFHYTYLDVYKISGSVFANRVLFYVGFFAVVFIGFKLFLIRLYKRRKRKFLGTYEVILHPFLNISVLSFLFLLKGTSVMGFDPTWDSLIGCWIIFSVFFALYATFIWLHSFRKGKPLFQTVWIPQVAIKQIKLYLFSIFLLILGLFTSLLLIQYFLKGWVLPEQETLFVINYLTTLPFQLFILFLAVATIIVIVNIKTRKYCKICLELIEKRLFSKKYRRKGFTPNEEFIHIFPSVIDDMNTLLKKNIELRPFLVFNASYPPRIINKDQYPKKLLMADIIKGKEHLNTQDKQRLKDVREGLDKMRKSLKIKGEGFFYPFVEGLTQIANSGEAESRFNFEDGFELKLPSFTRRLKEYHWLIESIIAFILVMLAILRIVF